jgi:hypothetical protein
VRSYIERRKAEEEARFEGQLAAVAVLLHSCNSEISVPVSHTKVMRGDFKVAVRGSTGRAIQREHGLLWRLLRYIFRVCRTLSDVFHRHLRLVTLFTALRTPLVAQLCHTTHDTRHTTHTTRC